MKHLAMHHKQDPMTPLAPPICPVPGATPVACSSCNLRELCLPVGFSDQELKRLDGMVATRLRVRRGDTLFRSGDHFEAVYAVRTGFFKTRVSSEDGRDQVTGFQMAGELLGLDGIGTDRHTCDAVALEDSQVCVIPYEQLEHLSREFTDLQRHPSHHEPRDRPRPWRDAAAGQHARRRASGHLPAEPRTAPAGARLLALVADPAHDATGDRDLPGAE